MNDFQTINEIIANAVEKSSYYSVIISSIVFIIYTIILKVFEYYKNKVKNASMMEMAKAVKEVSNNVVKLNNVLDKVFESNTKKDIIKSKSIIELAFVRYKVNIEQFCITTIQNNNIQVNKEMIIQNLNQLVNTEYYNLYSVLSVYEVNDFPISTHLKSDWNDEVCKALISIIYNNQSNEIRINQISSKLSITTNNYITYLHNKTFNS